MGGKRAWEDGEIGENWDMVGVRVMEGGEEGRGE